MPAGAAGASSPPPLRRTMGPPPEAVAPGRRPGPRQAAQARRPSWTRRGGRPCLPPGRGCSASARRAPGAETYGTVHLLTTIGRRDACSTYGIASYMQNQPVVQRRSRSWKLS
jgi:hypothetical protein